MGENQYGQLGDGTYNSTNLPEEVVSNGVVAIAAGDSHSLFLKADGSLWGMGLNGSGQLGGSVLYSTNLPVLIVPGGVTGIAAGGDHTLFLKGDGSLWVLGDNGSGEAGDGNNNNVFVPVPILEPTNYSQITIQFLGNDHVRLSYVGVPESSYALDRTFNLSPPVKWVPQATNPASANGLLLATNTPVATTNNFWRVRSVP